MPEAACLSDAFLQQSPACHWIVDANRIFVRVYGDPSPIFARTADELTGRNAAEVLEPGLAAAWSRRFARAFQGEVFVLGERRDSASWIISVFPIRIEGEIRYAAGLARETTAFAKAERELRSTVLGALKAQEFERNMVSKFLHDSVGQNLTALGLQLDLVRMDLETLSPQQCLRIVEIQKLLGDMMEEVREYSYELNPSTVERAGLRPALDRLATRLRARFAGTLRLNVDPSLKLDKKIASALYQIAQEAVENAVQHSSCSAIEIAVKSTRTGTFLEVRDNGRGFDPADPERGGRGLGLLSMEHYAAQAGLDLSITSHHGEGTIVRAADTGVV
ncbi:MAG TPA: ATP-binding protein [Bryobacteraceae bacterium]|nr:ATP-binding protein [Bryobacteraceae bacterium]